MTKQGSMPVRVRWTCCPPGPTAPPALTVEPTQPPEPTIEPIIIPTVELPVLSDSP